MAKYVELSDLIRRRILNGDYAISGVPVDRQLAQETGVARMTVRRSLQQLCEEGFLVRGANGRIEVNRERNKTLQIAFLAPHFSSAAIDRWRLRITQAAAEVGSKVRPVLYTHWDDAVINDALEGFDGVFLLPGSERMPESLLERLSQTQCPLVVLDDDLSRFGLPSILQSSPVFAHALLDHLESLGCRKINCFNVQSNHSVIEQRIEQWEIWMRVHRYEGQLINEPVQPFGETLDQAHSVIRTMIARNEFDCDALFCVTLSAAIGAMRAMHEAGIRPGIDVAVCVFGGEGVASFQIPSLTALEAADVTPHISKCVHWMAQGGGAWTGPLLMQPSEPLLVVRESTSMPSHPTTALIPEPTALAV